MVNVNVVFELGQWSSLSDVKGTNCISIISHVRYV